LLLSVKGPGGRQTVLPSALRPGRPATLARESGGLDAPSSGSENAQMDNAKPARVPMDLEQYARRSREGPCFVCAILDGHPDYSHHDVYEDGDFIAFLAWPPTLLGYCIVAPKRHIESWVHDLDEDAFLALQRVAYRVAKAVAGSVPTERMYSLSLGSQQGNAHLHWHIAPLPPGVPYERQQYHALMAEHGVLDVDDESQAVLAQTIRSHLQGA
jgi:diadenosine tetraphosphate (Ap4A) HIT family hydrolase